MDSGIGRMGIFCFVLLITFAGIVSLIPSGFFQFNTQPKDYDNPRTRIPNKWYGINIEGYNFSDTEEFNITTSDLDSSFELGGRTIKFQSIYNVILHTGNLRLYYRYGFLNLLHEDMVWYINQTNQRSEPNVLGEQYLSYIHLNEDFENQSEINYKVVCQGSAWFGSSYFFVTTVLNYNHTAYSTPFEAWENDDLHILIGIDPTNENWNKDVWYIISNLIMFNTFEVFGTTDAFALVFNGIIWAMMFAPVAIFITAVILEVLPF